MSDCCCSTCDARMIELIQAIDDLRRSIVIVLQERPERASSPPIREEGTDDSWYWEHG